MNLNKTVLSMVILFGSHLSFADIGTVADTGFCPVNVDPFTAELVGAGGIESIMEIAEGAISSGGKMSARIDLRKLPILVKVKGDLEHNGTTSVCRIHAGHPDLANDWAVFYKQLANLKNLSWKQYWVFKKPQVPSEQYFALQYIPAPNDRGYTIDTTKFFEVYSSGDGVEGALNPSTVAGRAMHMLDKYCP